VHWCLRELAVDLVELAKLSITAVAGHHTGHVEAALPDSKALVVMDMTGQYQMGKAVGLGEALE
jgi:hypothetical protein